VALPLIDEFQYTAASLAQATRNSLKKELSHPPTGALKHLDQLAKARLPQYQSLKAQEA
jgi:hypothetical protein